MDENIQNARVFTLSCVHLIPLCTIVGPDNFPLVPCQHPTSQHADFDLVGVAKGFIGIQFLASV